eukprot:Nk52_evm2s2062 gene=Nk52_evmTU2s2062
MMSSRLVGYGSILKGESCRIGSKWMVVDGKCPSVYAKRAYRVYCCHDLEPALTMRGALSTGTGREIVHVLGNALKGKVDDSGEERFDFEKFRSLLGKDNLVFGKSSRSGSGFSLMNTMYSPIVPSTQDFLIGMRGVLPNGTVFIADEQVNGRGRGKNAWVSPSGCLSFSFTWNIEQKYNSRLVFIQYFVSLLMAESLNSIITKCVGKDCDLANLCRLKWPNDMYINGTKLGGIICNSEYDQTGNCFKVIVGVGANITNEHPFISLRSALERLGTSNGNHALPGREDVLADFLNRMERRHTQFLEQGFEPFVKNYYGLWLHSGQQVKIDKSIGGEGGKDVRIEGISLTSGYLTVRPDEPGPPKRPFEVHPDLTSLDLLHNLMKVK